MNEILTCAASSPRRYPAGAWARVVLGGLFLLAPAGAGAEVSAQAEPGRSELDTLRERVAALEQELAALRETTESRLRAMEERLAAAAIPEAAEEASTPGSQEERLSEEERSEIEEELGAILNESPGPEGAQAGGATTSPTERRFTSQTRTLNQLNPEISVTGDVFGTFADRSGDPDTNQFRFAEFELAFQSPLDPFSLAKAFVVQEEGEFEVEESYIDWTSLPGGLGIKLGAYRQDFGKLNRWHQHALPQADRPLVHQSFLGEEGLRGLGVSLSWLPRPFLGDYNEIWLQVTNDANDVAFSGRGFDDPVLVVHETNYWDITNASYLELGLSASTGVNDELGRFRTELYGVDWTYDWRPPAEALYKGLELRGELLWQRRESEVGNIESLGTYAYGTYRMGQRWYLGARVDWTELPGGSNETVWGVSPYVEWWQSEWVRIRLQYSHNSAILGEAEGESRLSPESENKLFFQVTWSLGPHKHEKY